MLTMLPPEEVGDRGKNRRRSRARNAPKFDVRAYLFGICGVDLTRINGIDTTTALKVISEVGPRPVPLQECQALHLLVGAVPRKEAFRRQSPLRRQRAHRQPGRPGPADGRRGPALQPVGPGRLLPSPVRPPRSPEGHHHKLARLIYTMLTKGTEYTDQGQDYYEERYRQRVMHHLTKRAEKLGFQLTPLPCVA